MQHSQLAAVTVMDAISVTPVAPLSPRIPAIFDIKDAPGLMGRTRTELTKRTEPSIKLEIRIVINYCTIELANKRSTSLNNRKDANRREEDI